jgi:cytochrome c biogenesis protein CcmG, thiol:disulfide interchange protein DsbE
VTIGRSIVARWTEMGRGLRILFVVNTILLFAALAGLLWVLSWPLGPSTDGGLTLDGEALLREEAERQAVAEGQPAPGFSAVSDEQLQLTTLGGDPVTLRDFGGRPLWVVFWATYCHACQLEEPDMRRAFEVFRSQGLTLLAIDVGEDTDVVGRYVEQRDLPWTVLIDDSGVAVDAFGAIGTPSHYFIGADGSIQSRAFGRLRYAEMEARLTRLIDKGRSSMRPGS